MNLLFRSSILKLASIILFLVIADQTTKIFLIDNLKQIDGYYIEITPFFDIVYSWNYGASFGFMRNYFQYSNYAFLIINSVIVAILFYMLFTNTNKYEKIALAMIIGGALGNIIDRIFRGAVFDFLYFHYGDFHFPAFNLADSFISMGAALYFCAIYFLSFRNSI